MCACECECTMSLIFWSSIRISFSLYPSPSFPSYLPTFSSFSSLLPPSLQHFSFSFTFHLSLHLSGKHPPLFKVLIQYSLHQHNVPSSPLIPFHCSDLSPKRLIHSLLELSSERPHTFSLHTYTLHSPTLQHIHSLIHTQLI